MTIARPTSDVSNDGWTPTTGTLLSPMVDESTPDDSDYVAAKQASVGAMFEVQIAPITDPQSAAGHRIKYRHGLETSAPGGEFPLSVDLRAGAASIATWAHKSVPKKRRISGVQHISWVTPTVTNSHVFGATAVIANTGGKTSVTATSMAAGSSFASITDIAVTDMSAGEMIGLDIGYPYPLATFTLRVIVSADPEAWDVSPWGLGKYASVTAIAGRPHNNRYFLTIPKSEFTLNGGFVSGDWANIYHVQVWLDKSAGVPVNTTEAVDLYGFYSGVKSRAAVCIAWDDSNDNIYDSVYLGTDNGGVGMPDYGFLATLYAIGTEIGEAGHATEAQTREMYDAGWDCAVHTVDPMCQVLGITWTGGVATATTLLPTPWNLHGFATSDVVPIYGADPYELQGNKTITVTSTTTFTFTTALAGSGTALGNITCPHKEGASIGDTSVQQDIIEAELAALQAYGFTRGNMHMAYANGVRSPPIVAMLAGLGYVTGRTTDHIDPSVTPTGYSYEAGLGALHSLVDQWTGVVDPMQLAVVDLMDTVSAAAVVAVIDQAIATGTCVVIYGHSVVPTVTVPGVQYPTARFYSVMDSLATRVAAGDIDVMTISQLADSILNGYVTEIKMLTAAQANSIPTADYADLRIRMTANP